MHRTIIVIETFTPTNYEPGSIQDIANDIENEAGEGCIIGVVSKIMPESEAEEHEIATNGEEITEAILKAIGLEGSKKE